ncbi:unnamed protein product, partial [Rotaria magnacalcarata]
MIYSNNNCMLNGDQLMIFFMIIVMINSTETTTTSPIVLYVSDNRLPLHFTIRYLPNKIVSRSPSSQNLQKDTLYDSIAFTETLHYRI